MDFSAHRGTVARMDMVPKLLISKKEAAQALSISVRSLEYLIARKELATRRVGKRVLVPLAVLHKFAQYDHTESLVPTPRPGDHLTIRGSE
jgi:excisionase family DNA binding protein